MEPKYDLESYFRDHLGKKLGPHKRDKPKKIIIDCDPGADDA